MPGGSEGLRCGRVLRCLVEVALDWPSRPLAAMRTGLGDVNDDRRSGALSRPGFLAETGGLPEAHAPELCNQASRRAKTARTHLGARD